MPAEFSINAFQINENLKNCSPKLSEIIGNKAGEERLLILCDEQYAREIQLALFGMDVQACVFVLDMLINGEDAVTSEKTRFKRVAVCSFQAYQKIDLPKCYNYIFHGLPLKISHIKKILTSLESKKEGKVIHVDFLVPSTECSQRVEVLLYEMRPRSFSAPFWMMEHVIKNRGVGQSIQKSVEGGTSSSDTTGSPVTSFNNGRHFGEGPKAKIPRCFGPTAPEENPGVIPRGFGPAKQAPPPSRCFGPTPTPPVIMKASSSSPPKSYGFGPASEEPKPMITPSKGFETIQADPKPVISKPVTPFKGFGFEENLPVIKTMAEKPSSPPKSFGFGPSENLQAAPKPVDPKPVASKPVTPSKSFGFGASENLQAPTSKPVAPKLLDPKPVAPKPKREPFNHLNVKPNADGKYVVPFYAVVNEDWSDSDDVDMEEAASFEDEYDYDGYDDEREFDF